VLFSDQGSEQVWLLLCDERVRGKEKRERRITTRAV
jgi:hypothetical protein